MPTVYEFNGIKVIRISDVPGFEKWLSGQTLPLIEESETPYDWAYVEDYDRFAKGFSVVD